MKVTTELKIVEKLDEGATICSLLAEGVLVASWASYYTSEPENSLQWLCKQRLDEYLERGAEALAARAGNVGSMTDLETSFKIEVKAFVEGKRNVICRLEAEGVVVSLWSTFLTYSEPSNRLEELCREHLWEYLAKSYYKGHREKKLKFRVMIDEEKHNPTSTLNVSGIDVASWVLGTSEDVELNPLEAICKKEFLVRAKDIASGLSDLWFQYSLDAPGDRVSLHSGGFMLGIYTKHGDSKMQNDVQRLCREELNRWRKAIGMKAV